jgi:hypothetical protein
MNFLDKLVNSFVGMMPSKSFECISPPPKQKGRAKPGLFSSPSLIDRLYRGA